MEKTRTIQLMIAAFNGGGSSMKINSAILIFHVVEKTINNDNNKLHTLLKQNAMSKQNMCVQMVEPHWKTCGVHCSSGAFSPVSKIEFI